MTAPKLPELQWIEAASNPWGVRVLDVRPITLGMLSTSQNALMAANAVSYQQDDGTGFIGATTPSPRIIQTDLRFRIGNYLADGALFIPQEMEQKWAIYYHQEQIFFIRSWLRQVQVIAEVKVSDSETAITSVRGTFFEEDEEPDFTIQIVDYLIRSHALDMVYPAPLPSSLLSDPSQAGLWCMSAFGNRAYFTTNERILAVIPERPLRTISLLHIAVRQGDLEWAKRLLDQGIPAEVLDRNGVAPLHWTIALDETQIANLLIARGSSVDVRTDLGVTPLMSAVEHRRSRWIPFFLDQGADINARDEREFTALHRGAANGDIAVVRLLLQHGALPHPEAQGHTPLSLAKQQKQTEIVRLLEKL